MGILIFVYGLLIGSFLNVCIYRIPREESVSFPGSHCPSCNMGIRWYDNIPLFSYLILAGRCRSCKSKISLKYPLVELLNAMIYLALFYKFKLSVDFIAYALISSILIVATFIDIEEMIIPDRLVIMILTISILEKLSNYIIYQKPINFIDSIGGLVLAGGLFLLIVIFSKGGMGGGDVTLIASLGFVLGIEHIILNIFLSFLLGAFISVFLLISKRKTRKEPIAFGPFIILSFFIVLFFGDKILNFYWQLFI